MQGVNAVLPRYFADVDRVMDPNPASCIARSRCRGFTMAELTKRPHSLNQSERQTDHEALVAYVVGQSRGAKVNLPQSHPKERESFLRGEKMFFFKGAARMTSPAPPATVSMASASPAGFAQLPEGRQRTARLHYLALPTV